MIRFIARVVLHVNARLKRFILLCKIEIIKDKCTIGNTTVFLEGANVCNLLDDKSKLCIGNESRIQGQLIVHPNNGKIIVGECCYVGVSTRIWSAESITIGDRVLISHGVNIHDFDSHPEDPMQRHIQEMGIFKNGHTGDLNHVKSAPIVIGDDVWIGFGSTILKGVKIGNGCIIGANTLISTDIEEYSVVVGSPSRTIRKILK